MAYTPRVGAVPVSKVEIRIQCNKLLNKDVTSKSDPCAVMMMQDKGRWYEFGRTENIMNCLSPQFATSFEVDYYFEEVQKLRFAVYDIDNKTPDLSDDDFLGAMECTLGQVVSGSPYKQKLLKKGGKPAGEGTITVTAEELKGINDVLHLSFKAQHLDKKDFLGKSDPYLEFSRQAPDNTWQVVHRTEVVKNNLNPQWKPFQIKVQKLCAGDFNRQIRVECYDYDEGGDSDLIGHFELTLEQCKQAVDSQVECYDYDNDGSHDFIGSFNTNGLEMKKAIDGKVDWPCINPKKKAKKKGYQNSGVVTLTSCRITKEYSFLDFIFGGLQINFTVGIDFTASNGDPRNPQSLHYINPYQPNEYVAAIQSVGAVVQDYDSDKMFPTLGFGARIPPKYEVSHEFAINFNGNNPFCAGISGIVEAYKACIGQVQLYGPTNFSPIIYHVAQFAAAAQREEGARSYFVLLIITDGVISDMNDTLQAIVYASTLPMSLIIVGVGEADFTAMDILDGDQGVLRAKNGQAARRDIVQFVPFGQFKQAPPAELAKHVLAEVPSQVTNYFKMQGIVPAPPTNAPVASAPPQ